MATFALPEFFYLFVASPVRYRGGISSVLMNSQGTRLVRLTYTNSRICFKTYPIRLLPDSPGKPTTN